MYKNVVPLLVLDSLVKARQSLLKQNYINTNSFMSVEKHCKEKLLSRMESGLQIQTFSSQKGHCHVILNSQKMQWLNENAILKKQKPQELTIPTYSER